MPQIDMTRRSRHCGGDRDRFPHSIGGVFAPVEQSIFKHKDVEPSCFRRGCSLADRFPGRGTYGAIRTPVELIDEPESHAPTLDARRQPLTPSLDPSWNPAGKNRHPGQALCPGVLVPRASGTRTVHSSSIALIICCWRLDSDRTSWKRARTWPGSMPVRSASFSIMTISSASRSGI